MFYLFMRYLVYPFIRLFMDVKVTGTENIPKEGGYIICANHTSLVDVLALAVPFKCHIRYMGKEEIFKIPIINLFFKALGAFAVKRGKGDIEAINKACDILKNGGVFGIFPEGTRTKNADGSPMKAKTGAAMITMKTKAPILPVSIKYSTGKARCFCKTYVNIGGLIEYREPEEGTTMRAELRAITENLMGEIKTLWEMES